MPMMVLWMPEMVGVKVTLKVVLLLASTVAVGFRVTAQLAALAPASTLFLSAWAWMLLKVILP